MRRCPGCSVDGSAVVMNGDHLRLNRGDRPHLDKLASSSYLSNSAVRSSLTSWTVGGEDEDHFLSIVRLA